MGACAKMETNTSTIAPQATPATQDDLLFLHLQHHPSDISSKDLRLLYENHCGDLFKQELGITRTIVAYSRPRNIGEYVTQAKFYEAPERSASSFMGEYKQGLDP